MSNIPFDYQHILDNAFNELFNNNSQNFALQYQDFIYDLCNNVINPPPDDDLPDLIPVIEQEAPVIEEPLPVHHSNQMQLWSNLVEDYNAQIQLYQQNIQSIIRITENVLQVGRTNANANANTNAANTNTNVNTNTANTNTNANTNSRRNLISQLRNLFQSSHEPYILEIENITPFIYSRSRNTQQLPTTQEIQNATELFVYDTRNPIEYTTCPISLEEFREGEPLMRIRDCGHIFKAFELQRWFLRNTRCPSCRFDICSR